MIFRGNIFRRIVLGNIICTVRRYAFTSRN